jgi:DNA-binding MarR family transcriptional regulator
VLGRLDRCGSQSVSDLAAAERVRPQSMAQTVGDLEADELVERKPDPDDRRRALVILTAAGKSRIEADRRAREGWLVKAFEEMPEADLAAIERTVEILRRVADADV